MNRLYFKIPLLLLIVAAFFFWDGRPFNYYNYLMDHGVSARGTITDIWETGNVENDKPQVGVSLSVQPSEGSAFQAETYCVLSTIGAADFRPGAVVPVMYDPANPSRAAIASDNCTEFSWSFIILITAGTFVLIWTGWPFFQGRSNQAEAEPVTFSGESDSSQEPSQAARRLEELNELRDRGLITEAEYQEKREDILQEL